MHVRFIIARHSENLKWTHELSGGEILIYNSGDMIRAELHQEEDKVEIKYVRGIPLFKPVATTTLLAYNPKAQIIPIENKGREAAKWLEYLVNYYDKYADLNIFLQGYPFDHITLDDIAFSLKQSETGTNFGYINGPNLDNDWELEHWNGNPHGYSQSDIYRQIYGNVIPERLWWRVGAQFFITKELLMVNQRRYYERLHDVLHNFVEDGPYCYERSWLTFIINSPEQYRVRHRNLNYDFI